MEKMVFKPSNCFITEEQANKYGKRLVELAEENQGIFNAEIVVNDAQYESSPLHDYFEWDNSEAAQKWRLHQARVMIGSINMVIVGNEKEEEIRAFQHLSIKVHEKEARMAYTTTIRALSEPELYQQMLDQALRELVLWRKRYKQYKELGGVCEIIESAEEQLKLVVPA